MLTTDGRGWTLIRSVSICVHPWLKIELVSCAFGDCLDFVARSRRSGTAKIDAGWLKLIRKIEVSRKAGQAWKSKIPYRRNKESLWRSCLHFHGAMNCPITLIWNTEIWKKGSIKKCARCSRSFFAAHLSPFIQRKISLTAPHHFFQSRDSTE